MSQLWVSDTYRRKKAISVLCADHLHPVKKATSRKIVISLVILLQSHAAIAMKVGSLNLLLPYMTMADIFIVGHFSKECPKPRDYSKVKCQNCGESE